MQGSIYLMLGVLKVKAEPTEKHTKGNLAGSLT